MEHKHFTHLLLVLNEMNGMKNISYHMGTLSIPKVAKNGQKVPISANSEIGVVLLDKSALIISGWLVRMFYNDN